MEGTSEVLLFRWWADIHSDPPQNATGGQGSGIRMRMVFEKLREFLPIGKIVDVVRWHAGGMDDWTPVLIKSTVFKSMGVEDLKWDPAHHQLEDQVLGSRIPPFPLYLQNGQRVFDEYPPVHIPHEGKDVAQRSIGDVESCFERPGGEVRGGGEIG
jgi:hypothetical protein